MALAQGTYKAKQQYTKRAQACWYWHIPVYLEVCLCEMAKEHLTVAGHICVWCVALGFSYSPRPRRTAASGLLVSGGGGGSPRPVNATAVLTVPFRSLFSLFCCRVLPRLGNKACMPAFMPSRELGFALIGAMHSAFQSPTVLRSLLRQRGYGSAHQREVAPILVDQNVSACHQEKSL